MKTTIYELLGMIKDGNIPQKIIFGEYLYTYNKSRNDYETFLDKFEREYLFDEYVIQDILNEPVKILETTITYNQDNYYQYQPYTGEVEIKYNSAKNLLESDKTYKPDKIEKMIVPEPKRWLNYATLEDIRLEIRGIEMKINEIIEARNER